MDEIFFLYLKNKLKNLIEYKNLLYSNDYSLI